MAECVTCQLYSSTGAHCIWHGWHVPKPEDYRCSYYVEDLRRRERYRREVEKRMARIDAATRQRVIELHKQGLTLRDIARQTGVSLSGAWHIVQAAGTSDNSDKSDKLARDAQALVQHGFTPDQVAEELGVSADQVREILGGQAIPAEWSCDTCGHAAVCKYSEEAERHRAWAICRHWVARAG